MEDPSLLWRVRYGSALVALGRLDIQGGLAATAEALALVERSREPEQRNLERRMDRLEQKMDRVIQALEKSGKSSREGF